MSNFREKKNKIKIKKINTFTFKFKTVKNNKMKRYAFDMWRFTNQCSYLHKIGSIERGKKKQRKKVETTDN